jgi:hypothetical protein
VTGGSYFRGMRSSLPLSSELPHSRDVFRGSNSVHLPPLPDHPGYSRDVFPFLSEPVWLCWLLLTLGPLHSDSANVVYTFLLGGDLTGYIANQS